MELKHNEWGDPRLRYDHNHRIKFDRSNRYSPTTDEAETCKELLKNKSRKKPLEVSVQPQIADLILKTKGMVGLVLGSTSKSLLCFNGDMNSLNTHHDFDVLVLNPFAMQHPYPRECGIDWWVQPHNEGPTNGSVSLSYGFALDEKLQMPEIPKIKPGLYLPTPETLEKVADFCTTKYQNLENELNEVIKEINSFLTDAENKMHRDQWKVHENNMDYFYFKNKWERAIKRLYTKLHTVLHKMFLSMSDTKMRREINFRMKKYRECYLHRSGIDSYFCHLLEMLEREIQNIETNINHIDNSRKENNQRHRGDFSYLKIPEGTQLRPAFPVLPSDALIFKEY